MAKWLILFMVMFIYYTVFFKPEHLAKQALKKRKREEAERWPRYNPKP